MPPIAKAQRLLDYHPRFSSLQAIHEAVEALIQTRIVQIQACRARKMVSICAPGHTFKLLQLVLRKIQFSGRHIFLQVSNGGCPWNRKDVWKAVE
jgi:hypothetical protein